MIISIESSTKSLSLALLKNDLIVSSETFNIKNELAQIIVPTIKNFLHKSFITTNHLSCVVAGCGPGSFTGIRTVIAAANGIVVSNNNLQSVGVSGLAGLAMSVVDEALKKNAKYIISLIDTKRDDVFLQLFKLSNQDKIIFPFFAINKIEVLKIEHLYEYLIKHNIIDKDILVVGHEAKLINSNIINITISEKSNQYPNAICNAKLALYLINKSENINNKDIAFDNIEPIYSRLPQIN